MKETIADIVAEMRHHARFHGSIDPADMIKLCDRIEAAANELKKQSDDYRNMYSVALIDIAHLHDEVEILRAAQKIMKGESND